jgi:hypothetical protein
MYEKIIKMKYLDLLKQIKEKAYINEEKKKLIEALLIQKNCMGFVIAVCVELKKFLNNACLQ